jgi:hypothetical protein
MFTKGHITWHGGTKGLKPNKHKGETKTKQDREKTSEAMRLWWVKRKAS